MRPDARIIALLHERIAIAARIGKIKSVEKINIKQDVFWKHASQKRKAEAAKTTLNPVFVKELFEIIHKESIRVQEQIKKEA